MLQKSRVKPTHFYLACTIFAFYYILNGQSQKTVAKGEGTCDVVRVIESKNTRLYPERYPETETHCNMGKVECFFRCLNSTECLSFAVMVNESCSETWCLLYKHSFLKSSRLLEDNNSTYYFMHSPCCGGVCLNEASCRSKDCTCACKKGYTSTNCTCPTNNVSHPFAHEWEAVPDNGQTQIDSGGKQTWAVRSGVQSIWILETNTWISVDGGLTHVTSGKSGVWGVNSLGYIWYRGGVTTSNPSGTYWKSVTGALKQIDSGSSGVVYGVTGGNEIYCRSGITASLPYGTSWTKLDENFKYVSCGDYGCWAIKPDDSISFRTGVTIENCAGTRWIDVDGKFMQLEAGLMGRVYAISPDNFLFYRYGVCALNTIGNRWKKIDGPQFTHLAVGDNSLFAIAVNGTIFTTR